MILQRFSVALRKQDWFTVIVETLIVVFGVFIGLQVNNWNENRELTKRGIALEAQLAADVRLIIEETRGHFAHIEQSLVNVDWLKQAFSQSGVAITEEEFTEHGNILTLPTPAKRSPAYIEALNSGGLGLIREVKLRTALVKWDRLLEDSADTQQAIREFSRAYLIPVVRLEALYDAVPFDQALEHAGNSFDLVIALDMLENSFGATRYFFQEIEVESVALLKLLEGDPEAAP